MTELVLRGLALEGWEALEEAFGGGGDFADGFVEGFGVALGGAAHAGDFADELEGGLFDLLRGRFALAGAQALDAAAHSRLLPAVAA